MVAVVVVRAATTTARFRIFVAFLKKACRTLSLKGQKGVCACVYCEVRLLFLSSLCWGSGEKKSWRARAGPRDAKSRPPGHSARATQKQPQTGVSFLLFCLVFLPDADRLPDGHGAPAPHRQVVDAEDEPELEPVGLRHVTGTKVRRRRADAVPVGFLFLVVVEAGVFWWGLFVRACLCV